MRLKLFPGRMLILALLLLMGCGAPRTLVGRWSGMTRELGTGGTVQAEFLKSGAWNAIIVIEGYSQSIQFELSGIYEEKDGGLKMSTHRTAPVKYPPELSSSVRRELDSMFVGEVNATVQWVSSQEIELRVRETNFTLRRQS